MDASGRVEFVVGRVFGLICRLHMVVHHVATVVGQLHSLFVAWESCRRTVARVGYV